MTEAKNHTAHTGAGTAHAEPDKPLVQEFPKTLYREKEADVPDAEPDHITVADKKAEDEAKAEGFSEGPEFQKKEAEKKKAERAKVKSK